MHKAALLKQSTGLLGWLTASFITGGVGAIASVNAGLFYSQLVQPSWAPPAWLFSPVWSTLYLLMAISAWLVWRRHGFAGASIALGLFILQLIVNAAWSWLFFVGHWGALSMAEIIVLWILILATVLAFWRHHKLAALLLVPYLAWVSFATALTFALWQANPAILG